MGWRRVVSVGSSWARFPMYSRLRSLLLMSPHVTPFWSSHKIYIIELGGGRPRGKPNCKIWKATKPTTRITKRSRKTLTSDETAVVAWFGLFSSCCG